MKKIVFVNKTLLMGGIEKCIELLCRSLKGKFEIEVVYLTAQNLDPIIVEKISKYAKISDIKQYQDNNLRCDICIWCSLYFDYSNIKKYIVANRYYAWIHSMPRVDANCLLDDDIFVQETSEFICVSEAVKNNLNISKPGIVIRNFVDSNISSLANDFNPFENYKGLKLVTVSRLSRGKGFERVKKMVDNFEKNNIEYTWIIVGNGRSKEQEIRSWFNENNHVIFVGKQANPYPYIKNADYLVQLSDDESWCIVITEALSLHVPVVVTDFESSKEQIENLKNGIVVSRECTDFSCYNDVILSNKEKLKSNLSSYSYNNEIQKWIKILN